MYGNYRLTTAVSDDFVDKYGRDIKATTDATTTDVINRLFQYEEIGSVNEFRTLKEIMNALEDDRK